MGFVDFAGSTVVHSTGGWVALAAILAIGPRRRRFGPGARRFEGSNLALSTGGVMLLWIGWLGFNGGSTASDVATFGGARGDSFTITAYQGVWYTAGALRNVTLG